MSRTPGFLLPSGFANEDDLKKRLQEQAKAAGFTPLSDEFLHSVFNETSSIEDVYLAHFGVRGMHWGVRKDDHPGASRRTNKEAAKDAHEFARAKMFHGEGAGTRRKLIKATVDAKKKQDPTYSAAFDHHLARQDMADHAQKARSERKRKDVKASAGKTARGLNRSINGPFAPAVGVVAIVAGYGALKTTGMDKRLISVGKGTINKLRYGTSVDLGFLK
jgi:hypothetical protein